MKLIELLPGIRAYDLGIIIDKSIYPLLNLKKFCITDNVKNTKKTINTSIYNVFRNI